MVSDERLAEPTEGSWVYLSEAMQVPKLDAATELYDRVADACLASGFYAYRPYAKRPEITPALVERLRHAVAHADACLFYVGRLSSGVGAELAWATDRRRPVIAVQMDGDEPSPLLESMLSGYDRAVRLRCVNSEDCALQVRATLADPRWHEILRMAEAELAEDLL